MYSLRKLFSDSYRQWIRDEGMTESAALSYYAMLSLPALLLFTFSMGGIILRSNALQEEIFTFASDVVGKEAAISMLWLVKEIPDIGTLNIGAIIGFIFVFISSSKLFYELKMTFNRIWKVRPKKAWNVNYINKRLLSLATVVTFGFLLIIGVIVEGMLLFVYKSLDQRLGNVPDISTQINFTTNFLVMAVFFMFIYRVILEKDITFREEFVGAFFTVFFITLSKVMLSAYFAWSNMSIVYGTIGHMIAILIWVYYSFCVITYGAEITKSYGRHYEGKELRMFVLGHHRHHINGHLP